MSDHPRLLRDLNEAIRREEEIDLPHVVTLNNWVRSLRSRLGPNAIVPWFDPQDGGCEAQILWLLEAPGAKATRERGGSGFISCNNNDSSAKNTWETREEAGVPRRRVVHWNAIPYYIGTATKIRAFERNDVAAVGPLLSELLSMLPRLHVVILGGLAAQKVWKGYAPPNHSLEVIGCPHPSPRNLNSRPASRVLIVDAWRKALRHTAK